MEMQFIASANKWGCWIDPDCLLTVEDWVYNSCPITDPRFWFMHLGEEGVTIDEYTDLGDDALSLDQTGSLVDLNLELVGFEVHRATILPGLVLEISDELYCNDETFCYHEDDVMGWLTQISTGGWKGYQFIRLYDGINL